MDSSSGNELNLIRSLPKNLRASVWQVWRNNDHFNARKSGHQYVFEFPATWSVTDWYDGDKFSASRIDHVDTNCEYFPSLKVLGTGEFATVNKAFFQRFRRISTRLRTEVDEIVKKNVKSPIKSTIVFTGQSSGGAIAIFATVWFLEKYRRFDITPLCITYGAPLVGDKIFGHALRRERLFHETKKSWASCFINVVSIRDLAPRIHFSPLKDIKSDFLQSLLQAWEKDEKKKIPDTNSCKDFFTRLVNNAFAVASYDSCVLRSCPGGTSLLEAVKDLVELSPYRPFGSFCFIVGDGKPLLRVDNHDAVLQILFYSLQLEAEGSIDLRQFMQERVEEHLRYETMTESLEGINPLDNLNELPLSQQNSNKYAAFDALKLGTEARLSLRAAGLMEAEREKNLSTVNGYRKEIDECLKEIEGYQEACAQGAGYYDAFKLQHHQQDFKANVKRLELIGYWEEVRELLKEFKLPDSFETDREWVQLGTRIRFLLEPIDIANFYRHGKKDQTGLYETRSRARPNYYKYPENWLQHMRRIVPEDDPLRKKEWNLDSCFWARVENMIIRIDNGFDSEKENVLKFEEEVKAWLTEEALKLSELKRTTFQEWWKKLPVDHKQNSCISKYMDQEQRAQSAH